MAKSLTTAAWRTAELPGARIFSASQHFSFIPLPNLIAIRPIFKVANIVSSDLSYQNSQRYACSGLSKRSVARPTRANFDQPLRPEDVASNIGLIAMQNAIHGWPQQQNHTAHDGSTISYRTTSSRRPLSSTMSQSIPFPIHSSRPPSSV